MRSKGWQRILSARAIDSDERIGGPICKVLASIEHGGNLARRCVTVLGVHDGHDAGALLIRDGKVLAALQEERLRNIKHYNGIPEYSMKARSLGRYLVAK